MKQFAHNISGAMVFGLLLGGGSQAAVAEDIPIIDTHAHLEQQGGTQNFSSDAAVAVKNMEEYGISKSILMPSPQAPTNALIYQSEALQPSVSKYSTQFILMGGGGSLNPMIQRIKAEDVTEEVRQKFRQRAEEILAQGAVGFGEMAIVHFSLPQMGPHHPYEAVPADHPLLLLLADIAAEHDVPMDVHLDVSPEDRPLPAKLTSPPNPATLPENLAAFERLLDHNPKAKIVWAHVGTDPGMARTPALCRQLLERHGNLYMSIRVGKKGPGPMLAMAPDGTVKPVWQALFASYPERFVIGSDQFYPPFENARRTTEEGLPNLRELVNALPPELARKIAYENAERLYHISK